MQTLANPIRYNRCTGYTATQGMMLAVASNKYQEATSKLIKQYFPQITFAQVFGQREGVPAKPDPSVILKLLRKRE